MITEKTKLILRLVEEQKITSEEALTLLAPDMEPIIQTTDNPAWIPYWAVPVQYPKLDQTWWPFTTICQA